MAHELPSTNGAFNSLPIEVRLNSHAWVFTLPNRQSQLNKAIAHELGADKDIAAYRIICKATNDAVDADNCSFWRAKFRERYDFKDGQSNTMLAAQYQNRAKQLRRGRCYGFFRGHRIREQDVMKVLRDLIVGKITTPLPTFTAAATVRA